MMMSNNLFVDQLGVLLNTIDDLACHGLGFDHVLYLGKLEVTGEKRGDHGYECQDQGWNEEIALHCRESIELDSQFVVKKS